MRIEYYTAAIRLIQLDRRHVNAVTGNGDVISEDKHMVTEIKEIHFRCLSRRSQAYLALKRCTDSNDANAALALIFENPRETFKFVSVSCKEAMQPASLLAKGTELYNHGNFKESVEMYTGAICLIRITSRRVDAVINGGGVTSEDERIAAEFKETHFRCL